MNAFAVLRLLLMSDQDKDTEILALLIRAPYWSANSAAEESGSPAGIGVHGGQPQSRED
ncbi:hypothetical protein ACFY1B_38215 [Streptomyces mirabilis]|jgi:hypothetical protein|uniref:hypothetical protein n=1 Tax=Streptomyces TaxID=1883 RepID=UPI0029B81E78|nr:hypothetical protein [Streptomyces sp. AK02-04a]MDX3758583.1 hypothetical protein [Streptomyces sp. AK02-04a]